MLTKLKSITEIIFSSTSHNTVPCLLLDSLGPYTYLEYRIYLFCNLIISLFVHYLLQNSLIQLYQLLRGQELCVLLFEPLIFFHLNIAQVYLIYFEKFISLHGIFICYSLNILATEHTTKHLICPLKTCLIFKLPHHSI